MEQLSISWTSKKAYKEIQPQLGARQSEVLSVLDEGLTMTNTEISKRLNLSINQVTPRIKELRDKGLVRQYEVRPCKYTGKTYKTWGLV